MSNPDRALKNALVELERRLMAAQEQADHIYNKFGIRFIALHPNWTSAKKPMLQLYCGITEAAEVLGKEIKIEKDFPHEEANFIHRGCKYLQLPEYDAPRYRKAWEK